MGKNKIMKKKIYRVTIWWGFGRKMVVYSYGEREHIKAAMKAVTGKEVDVEPIKWWQWK